MKFNKLVEQWQKDGSPDVEFVCRVVDAINVENPTDFSAVIDFKQGIIRVSTPHGVQRFNEHEQWIKRNFPDERR
jgi:hypothetical protein